MNLDNIDCYGINGQPAECLIALVRKAQRMHTLLVFLFHGVGGGHSLNFSSAAHRNLLHYLKANEKNIWVAPTVDVAETISATQQSESK